ncbi:DNA-binding protein HU [Parendozoicomonas haliclonae]|uniref:DNA-binding protein HU n=1 Tax=Parendozoicomonas haliclonae TaxID=1960125 RepID=A0A1X7AQB8_9GAMM|nr:DNA-binding protein HU [Parendozoicomonas haliclonae]
MRKPELVAAIADQADLSKDQAAEALSAIIDQITQAMERQETVNLIGFGSFTQRARGARTGKNPQTGEAMQIPASNTVAFKPGKALKDAVNK